MKQILLPPTLGDALDLEAINQQLMAGEATLDWSQVTDAPPEALAHLLAGLDLVTHANVLGYGTMSDAIADAVSNVLTGAVPSAPFHAPVDHAVEKLAVPYDADAPRRTLTPPSPTAIRDELQELVLRDLLGPAEGPEEEVREFRVRERYILGCLAPSGQTMDDVADDDMTVAGADGDDEGMPEPDALGPETMFPSSLGLSFLVARACTALRLEARWGRYERVHSETHTTRAGNPAMVWKRIPVEKACERLELKERRPLYWVPDGETPDVHIRGTARHCPEGWIITLFLVNDQPRPKHRTDTAWVFQPELIVEDADGRPIFLHRGAAMQPVLDPASAAEEEAMDMLYRRNAEFATGHGVSVHAELPSTRYDRALRLRTTVVPRYDIPATTMPTAGEVPELDALVLDMHALAEMETEALLVNLALLPAAYGRWIHSQRARLEDPEEGLEPYRSAAHTALDACERASARIVEGIELLRTDAQTLDAFRFMNRAMWLQRVHSTVSANARAGILGPGGNDGRPTTHDVVGTGSAVSAPAVSAPAVSAPASIPSSRTAALKERAAAADRPETRSWRLFQLAFILLNLPGIADLAHADRGEDAGAVADLLWFPTGGGKTEAYLGLTAFTFAIRRLQGVLEGRDGLYGVAVLMRYTLRLLTLQQFQRAAALVCACETIRQDAWYDGDTRWGSEPFRLGLWVGNRTTPNTTEESNEAVRQHRGQHRGANTGTSASPAQLTHCPWCGARIDPGQDITVEMAPGGRGRTFMYCGDHTGVCPFTRKQSPDEGLPVLVVDEEIYHRLPALLISTVDKFAQMPWRGEAQMLFGQVDALCQRHGFHSPSMDPEPKQHPARGDLPAARVLPHGPVRPPDLIIQDELHLISGPLGSLVGLYETAIDRLATWQVAGRAVRPKVIASTATIRRAQEQVRGLFLRSVQVFPPQGIDAEDNFFARQRLPTEETPGRRYMGIYAPGRRLKSTLIRVYVAYLGAAQKLYAQYGSAADPWMTLVGYFNSMRELGGMRRLVDDDVRSRLRFAEEHGLANRRLHMVEELTSRKSSADIPGVLEQLERRFDPIAEAERTARRERTGRGSSYNTPLDVLLATNMLSVGVDVQRLGLMVLSGQPKATAEYIQATSRVGRSPLGPGLICAVYNWTRPRDISHYESFGHYHATFYQQVEALSVTPFAPRARDRGLTALLVSLVRLGSPDLNANLGAGGISTEHPLVRDAVEAIVSRAGVMGEHGDAPDSVRQEVRRRLESWLHEAGRTEGGRRLGFKGSQDGLTVGLLQSPSAERWGEFTCLQSLRDVEPEIALVLNDDGLNDEPEPLQMDAFALQDGDDADDPVDVKIGAVPSSSIPPTSGVGTGSPVSSGRSIPNPPSAHSRTETAR